MGGPARSRAGGKAECHGEGKGRTSRFDAIGVASDGSGGRRPPDRRALMGRAVRNQRPGKGCDGDASVRRIVHQGAWENVESLIALREERGRFAPPPA